MALIDKASLLMVPSTYEAGKLYNVLPSGNRAPDNKGGAGYDQTRADFDFDRGSNAAATRINSSGLIEKYRENKLLQSNNFGTTWANVSSSETSGQEGYDGTTNAWLLTTTSAGGRLDQSVSLSGVQSFSIYAKANTFDFIFLLGLGASDRRANFDLANGVVATTQNLINSSIESMGNGWYRCSVTYNDTISAVRVYGLQADNDFTGTSGSIYIQSAQLESGLAATDVLTSGATTGKAGVLVDLPRINFDANGENGALLLEPSRQQLITQSEYLGDWSLTNGTLTTNATISPDGTKNAGRVVFSANGLDLKRTISVSASTTYTYTFYIKLESGAGLQGRFYDNSNSANIEYYDFTSQISGADWSRITRTFTTPSGCTEIQVWLLAASSSIVTASFWGAQLEAGSYASSYIPNHSGTGGVTRAADVNTLSNAISLDGDFALFWEGAVFEDDIMLYGSGTNAWYMNYTTSTGRIILDELSGRKVQAYLGSGTAPGVKTKILIKRVSGVHSVFANGTKLTNNVSVNSTTTLSLSSMFWGFSSSFYKGLEVNQSFVSKTELTDAECVTLTTL